MTHTSIQMFVIGLVIFAAATGYPSHASQEPVVIGVPLPLSGNLKEFGIIMKNSFEMAREAQPSRRHQGSAHRAYFC